jgi:hypothetical protein
LKELSFEGAMPGELRTFPQGFTGEDHRNGDPGAFVRLPQRAGDVIGTGGQKVQKRRAGVVRMEGVGEEATQGEGGEQLDRSRKWVAS